MRLHCHSFLVNTKTRNRLLAQHDMTSKESLCHERSKFKCRGRILMLKEEKEKKEESGESVDRSCGGQGLASTTA